MSPAQGAGAGRGAVLGVGELHERPVEVVQLQDAGEQEEARHQDAGEELGHAELLQAQVPQPVWEGGSVPAARQPQPPPHRAPDSLLIREAGQVAPVGGEVLELEGVDGHQHQHGVGHHQPPERLEQLPPQAVVDLPAGRPGAVRSARAALHARTPRPVPPRPAPGTWKRVRQSRKRSM